MGDYTYRLTLAIEHPDSDLSAIPGQLGLPAKQTGKKGDPRIAPNGRVTGSVYRHSSCSIQFGADHERDLPRGLKSALATLLPHKTYLADWSEKGATLGLFIGWFSDFNSRDAIDWKILKDLAELQISLDIDFYGPDEVQNDDSDNG